MAARSSRDIAMPDASDQPLDTSPPTSQKPPEIIDLVSSEDENPKADLEACADVSSDEEEAAKEDVEEHTKDAVPLAADQDPTASTLAAATTAAPRVLSPTFDVNTYTYAFDSIDTARIGDIQYRIEIDDDDYETVKQDQKSWMIQILNAFQACRTNESPRPSNATKTTNAGWEDRMKDSRTEIGKVMDGSPRQAEQQAWRLLELTINLHEFGITSVTLQTFERTQFKKRLEIPRPKGRCSDRLVNMIKFLSAYPIITHDVLINQRLESVVTNPFSAVHLKGQYVNNNTRKVEKKAELEGKKGGKVLPGQRGGARRGGGVKADRKANKGKDADESEQTPSPAPNLDASEIEQTTPSAPPNNASGSEQMPPSPHPNAPRRPLVLQLPQMTDSNEIEQTSPLAPRAPLVLQLPLGFFESDGKTPVKPVIKPRSARPRQQPPTPTPVRSVAPTLATNTQPTALSSTLASSIVPQSAMRPDIRLPALSLDAQGQALLPPPASATLIRGRPRKRVRRDDEED